MSGFNTSQSIIFQKSSYKNRPIAYGPKSLKLLCNESKHNILALVGKANKRMFWDQTQAPVCYIM